MDTIWFPSTIVNRGVAKDKNNKWKLDSGKVRRNILEQCYSAMHSYVFITKNKELSVKQAERWP